MKDLILGTVYLAVYQYHWFASFPSESYHFVCFQFFGVFEHWISGCQSTSPLGIRRGCSSALQHGHQPGCHVQFYLALGV